MTLRILARPVAGNLLGGRLSTGFTMVELIVTMIIVGVLAVSVLPRFDSLGVFDAAGFADQTHSLLRHAQKSAIAQRRWVAVDVAVDPPRICSHRGAPSCASACAGGSDVQELVLPGGVPRKPQASTTFAPGSTTTLCFDALGRPIAVGETLPMTTAASLAIRDAGAVLRTITVEPETGYVH